MFGPVKIIICCVELSRYKSFEIYSSPGGIRVSITGCRPSLIDRISSSFTVGLEYLFCSDISANVLSTSILEIILQFLWMSFMNWRKYSSNSEYIEDSRARIFSSAPKIFSSYSFNSCVMYLSALTRVCFRIQSSGTFSL
ncbi:hypothetical protein SDC9_193079 [bioreactor metagenome]|uniref:Uncharacterized protein n=1 Tax=bioreactor metagenome TaxID=1076179 RepID=A0A645I415_9ZZZZ